MEDRKHTDRTGPTSWADVPIILRPSDVADLIGVSRSTVHRYVAAGRLHGTYLSKRRLVVTKTAVQAMLGVMQDLTDGDSR